MDGVWGLVREPSAAPPPHDLWAPVVQQRREGPWSLGVVMPDGRIDIRHSTDAVQSLAEGGDVAVAALGEAQLFKSRGALVALHGAIVGPDGKPHLFTQEHADTLMGFNDPATGLLTMLTGLYAVTAIIGTRDALYCFRRGDALYRAAGTGVHVATPVPLGQRSVLLIEDRTVTRLPWGA